MSIDNIVERWMEKDPDTFPPEKSWKGPGLVILIDIIVNSIGIYLASTPITWLSYPTMVFFILNMVWPIIAIIVIQSSIIRIVKKKELIIG